MHRTPRFIAAVVFGTLTTVGFAWLATLAAPRSDRWPTPLGPSAEESIQRVLARVKELEGLRKPVPGLDVDRFDELREVRGAGYSERAWVFDEASQPPGGTWEFSSGWPFVALAGAVNNDTVCYAPEAARLTLALPTWVPSKQAYGAHLPLSPAWGGLAADVAIWSAAFLLLPDLRRRYRRARGRCGDCAHALVSDQARCPECGATTNNSRGLPHAAWVRS